MHNLDSYLQIVLARLWNEMKTDDVRVYEYSIYLSIIFDFLRQAFISRMEVQGAIVIHIRSPC